MKESLIIDKLLPYKSGGNYLLLYKIIEKNSSKGTCNLTQEEIAQKMKKTRKFVSTGLQVLYKIGALDFQYRKITLKGAKHE